MVDSEMLAKLTHYNQGLKILCVDDDEIHRNFLVTVLQNYFAYVDSAADGREALEKYNAQQHDIVITDLKMPVMSGIELARSIKSINPQQPIIAFSARPDAGEMVALINMSASHYLNKPFSTPVLIKTLHDLCEKIYITKEHNKYHSKLEKMVEEKGLKIRRQKEQIQKNNDFLQEVINSLHLPFLVAEIQHEKIIHANKEAENMLIPQGSSRFQYFFDKQTLRELTDKESSLVIERAMETEDQGLRLYTAYFFPVLEESGKIRQVIQYLVDITDKTRSQISSQGSDAKLRFELNNERIVSDIAKTANASLNLNDAVRKILFIFCHAFGISAAALYTVSKENKRLTLLADSALDASPVKPLAQIPFDDVSEKLLTEIKLGSKIVHSDLTKLDIKDRKLLTQMNVRSCIIMPVIPNSEVCGVLTFFQPEEFFWNFKAFNLYSAINGIIASLWSRS